MRKVFGIFIRAKTNSTNVIISASMLTNKKKALFPLDPSITDAAPAKIVPNRSHS